jgi:AcrR family transcriptional regulator
MPHPRQKVTDEAIFAAAQRAMTRKGPHELTLAHIAAEAGVSPGRLVQRFGSKRAMLLALAERFAGSAGVLFKGLRTAHPDALAALRAFAACMANLGATPDTLARNLAYLQIDLTDPEFRGHLLHNARATRRELEALVRSAINEGALREEVDPRALARTIETVFNGSLMTWACYRDGSAEAWMRRDLDSVLQPHLAAKPQRVRSRSQRPRPASRTRATRE